MSQIYSGRLANRNFILLCCCNLLYTTSMYMTMPVLPLYLTKAMLLDTGLAGVVVALYAIAALVIRPFSGFIVDSFQRKPVYAVFMLAFVVTSSGYIFLTNILLLSLARTAHGLAFGVSGTSINTMAVDFIPQGKVGTGIGIFGMLNSVSMAAGPMLGMFLAGFGSYNGVFVVSAILAFAALIFGLMVKTEKRLIKPRAQKLTLDNFFLKKGAALALGVILAGYSYGLMANYISLLADSRGVSVNTGVFFMLMAAGMFSARMFAGKLADKGLAAHVIVAGKLVLLAAFPFFLATNSEFVFFFSAFFFGLGFGMFSPAYQSMFISLADKDKIGTANSTYYTSWDVTISVAIFTGGYIARLTSLDFAFIFGTALIAASLAFFLLAAMPRYKRYRAENSGR